MRSRPRSPSQPAAASSSACITSGSSSSSRKPNIPQALPWNSLKAVSICALTRPTTRPSRRARNSSASPCLKKALKRGSRNSQRSMPEMGNPVLRVRVQAVRELYELAPIRARRDGRDLHGHGAGPYMPTAIDLFEKARRHERLEQLQAAREHDLMPYFRVLEGPAGPVVEMEGAERIMLGSNNYLGLTGDERVKHAARAALERYGTGLTGSRFLNGTLDLHLELEQRAGRVHGRRGRARLHHRLPRQHRRDRHAARPRRHRDLRLRRPRLDPRRGVALASADPAISATTGSTSSRRCCSEPSPTAAACSWSWTACSRWRETSRRCRT